MNQKQIAVKSTIYLIGNLSSKFISAALIPIYAFFVATAELGMFDYSQSIMNVLVPVFYLAFWEGILKFILVSDEKEKIINITASFGVFLSTIYLLLALIGIYFSEMNAVWICTCGMVITRGLAQIWQYACRALQYTKYYLIISMISAIVLLLSTIICVCIMRKGLLGLYLSYILGQLTLFVGIEIKIGMLKQISIKTLDLSLFREIVKFSIPLMFNNISMWLVPLFMRMIIVNKMGTEINGLYAFANKFNIVVNLLGTVVSMALVEEAIILSQKGKISKDYGITVSKIFIKFEQLTSMAIMIIVVGYSFLITTKYYITIHYFAWFLTAALITILGSYIGTVFQSINITKYQFITTLLGGIVGIFIAYILAPYLKLWSIVIGQMASCIVTTMSRYIVVCKKSVFRIEWKSIAINGIPVLIAVFLSTFCSNIYINVGIMIFYIIMVGITNYEIIKRLRYKLKK